MACVDPGRLRALASLAVSLLGGGCAAPAVEPWYSAAPPVVLVGTQDAGVRDLRASYRSAVCRLLPEGMRCDQVLLQLPGEAGARATGPATADARRYRIAFVPGLFSECFDHYARPFSDAQAALAADGFATEHVRLPGRGTSTANAARLADHFAQVADDPRPVIVFAYSKGLPDTLEFVVRHPKEASRIAAIVSVAGAANGSPLADDVYAPYRRWGASFPLPGCEPGSGKEIHDLRRDARLEWWRMNGSAVKVPVFALVAAPRPEQVSPATRSSFRRLARIEPRNDGKLLAQDQVVQGGYLLGYVNADHWAIAIPLSDAFPSWSALFRDGVPRIALARAAIEVVADTLAVQAGQAAATVPVSTGRAGTP
ncbi:MAG: hypothetical protein ACXWUM_05125 [Burkholderiaceae bacterium]